jgi:hypothetical protein
MKLFRTLGAFVVVAGIALIFGSGPTGAQSPFTIGQTYCLGTVPCVTTYHNNNNRDGVNPKETTLKARGFPAFSTFSRTDVTTIDGQIYAQPLYIHQLDFGGTTGKKDVVYVATENNSLYAIDPTSGASLVPSMNYNVPPTGGTETAVPYLDLPGNPSCANILPEVGITGTPVIDVSITPPVIWFVTKHEDNASTNPVFVQKLHGVFATTLGEIPGSPLTITATGFDPKSQNQRAGLTLVDYAGGEANIFATWGSHCDAGSYSGFLMEFDYDYVTPSMETTIDVFNDETGVGASAGGIWMSGGAPAVTSGSAAGIFLSVGNGAFSTTLAQYGESVLKLVPSSPSR